LICRGNPFNTRTIFLPPIEFLKLPIPEKLRPENSSQKHRYSRKIPAFWSLEGDFLHSFAGKDKARKSRQVTTDSQILPENPTASNYRNGRKISARNTMNATAIIYKDAVVQW
jgi:hypothetical protein